MSKILNGHFEPEKIDMKDVNMIEDIEEVFIAEAEIVLSAKKRKQQQQNQMNDMRNTDYYAMLVFCNQHDKNTFLSYFEDMNIEGKTFIDGYQFAKKMGIDIPMTASLPDPHYVKQLKIKQNKKI
jgi:hypothetical protein